MSLGTWEPASSNKLELSQLQAIVAFSKEVFVQELAAQETAKLSDDGSLPSRLAAASLSECQWLMKQPIADWSIADSLDTADLVALIYFFTLVEVRVPGWDSGKDSPVIPLVKLLRQREAFEPALRKWIKANTDNRYLPNGSAL